LSVRLPAADRCATLAFVRSLVAAVCLAVVVGCGGSDDDRVDCSSPPDFAAWREATTTDALERGDAEQTRWRVARHLVECRTLHGTAKRAALRTLGPAGLPDDETPADERNGWEFYLGPDGLQLDDMNMLVEFDRDGRVSNVEVFQS
jgi:hypothetical protein